MNRMTSMVMIVFAVGALAVANPYWIGEGDDNLWSNLDNWTYFPGEGSSPHMRPDWGMDNPPVFDESAGDRTYGNMVIGLGGSTIPSGTTTLTVTGGKMTVTGAFGLGWSGADPWNKGVLNMTGGDITADTLRLGAVGNVSGEANISGGQFFATGGGGVMFTAGHADGATSFLNLSGTGRLVTSAMSGVSAGSENHQVRFYGVDAELVLLGDIGGNPWSEWVDGLASWDQISAYDPSTGEYTGDLIRWHFDDSGPIEVTTVYAIPEPMTMALLGFGGLALLRKRK